MDLTLFIVIIIIIAVLIYIINIITDIKTDIRTINGKPVNEDNDNMKGIIDKLKDGLEYLKNYL